MFSKTCEYAIRAVLYIAQKSAIGKKAGMKEIAYETDSPEHFIAKILQELSRRDLVQSTKGPGGGFFFSTSAPQCTLADVVYAIDGDHIFSKCALGLKICSESQPCPLHDQFKTIRNMICIMLRDSKLVDLAAGLENQNSFLKSIFFDKNKG